MTRKNNARKSAAVATNNNATKAELVEQYLAAVEASIAKHPKLEWTRETSRKWAAEAKLGRLTRRVRTKGGYTDIARGGLVLYSPDEYGIETAGDCYKVWSPDGSTGSTCSLLDKRAVRPVCETCNGSGQVRHKRGLVSFPCPTC